MIKTIGIPGYKISELVSNTSQKMVYRGIRIVNNQSVMLKIPKVRQTSIEAYSKLTHEHHILQSIQSDAVAKSVELIKNGREAVLVIEDYGGLPLDIFLKMKSLKIKEILSICIRIAECIGEVHQEEIIHKDIKPSNILIHPDTLEVKLIDFGSATRLTQEYQTAPHLGELEGSSRYMSPEQTGRMNRPLDYRTDYYSFGITAYEMLTGKPPFLSNDLLELVHAHIALKPVAPHEINKTIPTPVSEIVLKCLSKNAEDRYLSVRGLIADLRNCLQQLEETGTIEPFPLALHDCSDRLQIPEKLYGRENEMQTLLDAFEQVCNGASRFLIVNGKAGMGKSALINEVQKTQLRSKARLIYGKFDQFKQNIPFTAIIQAFQELVRQLLMESQEELQAWRETILEAVQGMGQIIVDVIPQLSMIIGEQPPVPELPPTETKNRFQLVMQRFVRILARPEHPLVLFLDDIQWADTASLYLIQQMITDLQVSHFLMIGANRVQEENAGHPLVAILTESGIHSKILQQISLEPLGIQELNLLLCDTLYADVQETLPLSRILLQKTEGNPFFIKQYLKSLHERDLLSYDFDEKKWIWKIEEIEKLSAADNVADLLVEKVLNFPSDTRRLLACAACLGNTFFLHMIAKASQLTESETVQLLFPALQEGLLYPLEGEKYLAYLRDEEEVFGQVTVRMKFVHDRIQQAAYSLLSDDELKQVHLTLGKIMQQQFDSTAYDEHLFEMCDHLYFAEELIEDESERNQVAELHHLAGQRAELSTAYEAALKYLRRGTELLPEDVWNRHYELAIKLYTLRAEAEYLCNHFGEAERLFDLVLQHAKTNIERVRIHEIQIHMNTSLAKFQLVTEIANQALQLLGVSIPLKPGKLDIIREIWQVKRRLNKRSPELLLLMPDMSEENYQIAMNIISYAGPSSYFENPNWFALTILRVLTLSLKHGNHVGSANGYTGYGIVLSTKFDKYQTGYEFGELACLVADKFEDPMALTKAFGAFAILLNHWRNHAKTNIPLLKKAIQHGFESGSNIYTAYNSLGVLDAMLFCGFSLEEMNKQILLYSDLISQIKVVDHDDRLLLLQQAMHCLVKWKEDKSAFSKDAFDEKAYIKELEEEGKPYKRYMYNFYKFQILYFFEQYGEAAKLAIEANQWLETISGQLLVAQHVFMQTLAMTAHYSFAGHEEKRMYAKRIKLNMKKMKLWTDNCPENFQHKYLLMCAEWENLSGNDHKAADLYEQSIRSARQDGFTQNEAIACERAAKFYLSKGMETIAKLYMTDAYEAYVQWGAIAKAKDISYRYARLMYKTESKPLDEVNTQALEQSSSILDLMTVIKASQAMASEIKLEKLLATMLRTVISNAGAEKGILILKRQGEWVIEAAGSVNKDVEIMQSIPYEQSGIVSVAIVNYATRTEKMLVFHDASKDERCAGDPYIMSRQPKSVLCSPLWQQGRMIGIIYLENNLATHVFNEARTELLRLIFSQIAIFIENARLYHQLEKWNLSLENLVGERTEKIEKLLRENKVLLDNAGQGFLQFSSNLLVQSEYSRECLRIFGKEIAEFAIAELLYPDKKEEQLFIESLLQKYFETENETQKELYLTLLPSEIIINQLPVKLECKPIDQANEGLPEGLMMILTDLSEKRALEGKMEQEWQILKMVVTVVTNLELFLQTLHRFQAFFDKDWEAILSAGDDDHARVFSLIGQIHQFKGDFSQLRLIQTPLKLHELETELIELTKQEGRQSSSWHQSQLGAVRAASAVQSAVQQDMRILRQNLGEDFFEKKEQVISFSRDRWDGLQTEIIGYLREQNHQELLHQFNQLHNRPLKELLNRYSDYVASLATRLDKKLHPLKLEGDEIWVSPERFNHFVGALIHIFRNAIDHGIEQEEERLEGNKERKGTVHCEYKLDGDVITLSITDDGRGIDLEWLKAKCLEQGMVDRQGVKEWSEEKWLEQLFVEGFSRIEEPDEVSGRGVGLSVVKHELKKLGGSVEVRTSQGEGTSFIFSLPMD
ncbi:AAA family ATPase [Brevibacillus ginsengisoli]|uniref:AAA family ATPase n=1 Tax=Brevibacillus ginsengisoli TaxID=363854 RepID=UPI003CF2D379